jgi:hypothetical protein
MFERTREEVLMPRRTKDGPQRPPKPLPEELARTAIAHEEAASGPGDKVRMTFRVVLARSVAEALAARAIREEKNIGTLVTEILEAAGQPK